MNIENFLNPMDKSIILEDNTLTSNKLLDKIIVNHVSNLTKLIEEEEGGIIMPPLITSEALQAIKLLIFYSESQADLVTSTI